MATSLYSASLRLALPTTGDLFGTWGTEINNSITDMVDQAVAGRAVVSMPADADYTLTALNGTSDEARCAVLRITSGVSLTATRNVIVPTVPKIYIVENATSGGQNIQIKTAAGTGITMPSARTYWVRCDGTNVVLCYGDIVAGLGSALDPSYAFTGDRNTGMFSPAANMVAWATDGSERIRVDASGNFTIGNYLVTGVRLALHGNTVLPSSPPAASASTIYLNAADAVNPRLWFDAYGAASAVISARTAGGTAAAPTAVPLGQNMLLIQAGGYSGSAYQSNTVRQRYVAEDLWTATSTPAYWTLDVTPVGSTSPVERIRVDSAGQLGVGVTPTARNNTRLQIVDGVGFPATAVASSDANTLDDYEEGTWTPTVRGTTIAGAVTYSFQQGRYTKMGNLVFIELTVSWTAHSGTGQLQISNFPFSQNSGYNGSSIFASWGLGFTMSANTQLLVGNMTSGTSAVGLREYPLAGGTPAGISVSATGNISISGTYRTD